MKNIDPKVLLERSFREALTPDPVLTVSEWADKHRVLSKKAASESGPWRTDRTPYLREVMDTLSVFHPAKKIVFKKSSQIGGTECLNNWIGYIIDHAPGPTMLVQPTLATAERNARLRIEPLIEETPRLRQKVSAPRSKSATNNTAQKDFDGGTLIMTGANSAAGLRSMPAKFLALDEIDAYPRNLDHEGSPIELALARSRTFSRRKAFLVSTPTIDGMSLIAEEYENSDQRKYQVPCPHCSNFQVLKFDNLQWDEGKPETAAYYCEHCGEEIAERYKTKMLSNGKWVPENPGHETIGFFINALYSPLGWFSWADIARDYERAKKELEENKKTEKMMTFVNTVLGETYKEAGDAPEWKRLYLRRETYKMGEVPKGVIFLTAGADVQKDRIEVEVVGWGRDKESWSIEYQIFQGNTADYPVWDEFQKYMGKIFKGADGKEYPLKMAAVDSGYNTAMVYNFCRKFPPNRVAAVKGSDYLSTFIGHPKIVDAKIDGRVIRRAVKVWSVGVSILKMELYSWLKMDPPIGNETMPAGFCHFPEYDEEFFKQLTSEKVVLRRNKKGQTIHEWVKDRERNEALDCRIYARAAASMAGLDRFTEKDFQKTEAAPIAKPIESLDNKPKAESRPKPKRAKRHSDFWG